MKTNEKIMTAIKRRESLCDPFLTVGKILEAGGMGNWTALCCERVANAELIDGADVRINFLNMPDLEVTAEGMRMCREILECYVSRDILKDAHEILCLEESARYHINEVARILREMKWCDLLGVCVKGEPRERVYAREEVCQRLCFGEARETLRKWCCNIVVRVKFRKLLSYCRGIAADVAVDSGKR